MKQVQFTDQQNSVKQELISKDFELQKVCDQFEETVSKLDVLNQKILDEKNKIKEQVKSKSISSSQAKEMIAKVNQDFKIEKQNINQQLANKNQEMEKSFAELNSAKQEKTARETIAKVKEQLNILKSQIRVEKKEVKTANQSNKELIKKEYAKIDSQYAKQLKELCDEYKAVKKGVSKTSLIMIYIISAVVVLIAALSINYLVYYPQANGGAKYDFGAKESLIALGLSGVLLLLVISTSYLLLKDSSKMLPLERKNNTFQKGVIIGFITDFFDTIGIGSFAPTIVFLKALKANDDDKKIPGILNISHTVPVIFEAIIFIAAVRVDPFTLITLIAMAVIGSYFGAMLANKIDKKKIKLVMGVLLFFTAIMMLLSHPMIQVFKGAGNETGLPFDEWKIYFASFIFLILGGLMSLGIGLYAPAMAVVALLGMDVTVAFPIMMGSTAFLMPIGSIRFIQDKNYAPKVTVAIAIGGMFGVICAFLAVFVGFAGNTEFVKYLLFLVIVVIFYASFSMLYDFYKIIKKDKLQRE
ncbi:hypothetical protein SCHIN_v1c02040 [Spiroplasma chinense]|uniref:Probable membrane transporter protein n=1 Tax=Spiroplasma chinense TaxID=216932 RepID=A0A5B9Y5V1_9MOLU|nr:sulfite exporter TauE/SafE family protein [Spiroplasma chinense]QEH61402.1 hypothetical protein SCHIN_v1c02040 [Spiroplasma chinense]